MKIKHIPAHLKSIGKWLLTRNHKDPRVVWENYNPEAPSMVFLAEGETACSEIILKPFEQLQKNGELNLVVLFENRHSDQEIRRAIHLCDTLFAFRACTPRAENLFKLSKDLGKFTIWSADDDLLSLNADNPVGRRHQTPAIRNATRNMMWSADHLWLYSKVMANRYQSEGLNASWIHLAIDFFQRRDVNKSNTIRLGHIGDYSHAHEMSPVVEAINRLAKKSNKLDWTIDFAGYLPPRLKNLKQVREVPYIRGVDNFHKWLANANWDIGIAPLRESTFNACKTDNKFRTFAGFGIPGIYSNVSPYTDSVKDRYDGILVDNSPKAFLSAIEELMSDESLRNRICENSQNTARLRYTNETLIPIYRAFFVSKILNKSSHAA